MGKALRRGALLLVALGSLAGAAPAAATTFFVSTTGSDPGNDCTIQATPCLTIAHAVASAEISAGAATVALAPGTYTGPAALTNVSDFGMTITGTGPVPGATAIVGVSGASAPTVRYGPGGGPGSLTLSNLTVSNPSGDTQSAISGTGALTLNGVVAQIAGASTGSPAVSNSVGPLAITASTVTTLGTGRALLSSSGSATLTSATVSQTNTTSGSPAAVVQNGAATITASTITSAGNGGEAYQGQNASLTISTSTLSGTGHAGAIVNTFGNVALNGVTVSMPDAGDGATAVAIEGGALSMTGSSVSGAWTGPGLQLTSVGGAVIDSTISTADGGNSNIALSAQDATPGNALLIQRSTVAAGAGASPGAVDVVDEDTVLDSSLVLGGTSAVFAQEQAGKSNTTTIFSSTIDAGVPGTGQQVGISSVQASANGAGNTATINVSGSIILQQPAATVSNGGAATVACYYDDVQALVQAPSPTLGTVACPSGASGNVSSSPSSLFVTFGSNYQLLPGATAVDQVPESAVTPLPDGFTASTTDLAGNPRVVDGKGGCIALRDRGALELQGHSGTVPAVTIVAPPTVGVGKASAFRASVANVPAATLTWQFSDGASASGTAVTHVFATAGTATATVTATGSPVTCVGAASASVAVVTAPRLGPLKLAHISFRAGRHAGTKIAWNDDQAATTTFTVLVARAGRREGKSCRARSRANASHATCALEVALGHFSHHDVAGANRITFSGLLAHRRLAPGTYLLRAVAGSPGGKGTPVTRTFTILG